MIIEILKNRFGALSVKSKSIVIIQSRCVNHVDSVTTSSDPQYDRVGVEMKSEMLERIVELLKKDDDLVNEKFR